MKKVIMPDRLWQNDPAPSAQPEKVMKVKMLDSQWQTLGVLSPQMIRKFTGENTLDRFSIENSYATKTKNFTGDGFPSLSVRPGYTQMGNAFGAAVKGIGIWKNSEIHVIAGGSWHKWNGSSWVSLSSGFNSSDMSFCNFQGDLTGINLLAVNGSQYRRYDGSTVQNLNNVPAGATYIDEHDNRVYTVVGNKLHYSAFRKSQDWTTLDDAGEAVVETNNGESINGIKAGNRHIMVFKPNSTHELWGNGPFDYKMDTIATDVGLLSNKCVTVLAGTPYWMDLKGIYSYGGSRPRSDFSKPMKVYIEGVNKAQKAKASAGSDGKTHLYFSFPFGSATEPDTTLEYDTLYGTWYVWKDMQPSFYATMGGEWYTANGSVVRKMGGTTDNGAAIQFEWVSAPFSSGSRAAKLQWYRMWYVADVPAGSSLTVSLSPDAVGETWTVVKQITANNLQTGRVIIPVDTVANSNWVRVRFTGSGAVKIREFDYQQRELPMY